MKMVKDALSYLFEQVNWTVAGFAGKLTPIFVLIFMFLKDFFHPTIPMLFYVMALGALDVGTGLWASKREGKKIVSELFWRRKGAVVVLFMIGVICMLIIDRMLKDTHESIPAFAVTSWFLFYGLYECISVMENMTRIGMLPGLQGFMGLFKRKITDDLKQAIEEGKANEEEKK